MADSDFVLRSVHFSIQPPPRASYLFVVPEAWRLPANEAVTLERDEDGRQRIRLALESTDRERRHANGGPDQQSLFLAPVGLRPDGTWEVIQNSPDYVWYDRQAGYRTELRTAPEPYATRVRYNVAPHLVRLTEDEMQEVAARTPPSVWEGPGYVRGEEVILQQEPINSVLTDEVLNRELKKVYPHVFTVSMAVPPIDPKDQQAVYRIAKMWIDEICCIEVAKNAPPVPVDAQHLLRAAQNFRSYGRAQIGHCTLKAKQGDARFKRKMPANPHVVLNLRPATPPSVGFHPLAETARGVEGKAASTKPAPRTSGGPRVLAPMSYAQASALPSSSSSGTMDRPRSLLGLTPETLPQSTPAGSPNRSWPRGPSSVSSSGAVQSTPPLQAKGVMGPPVRPLEKKASKPASPVRAVSAKAPLPRPSGPVRASVPHLPTGRMPLPIVSSALPASTSLTARPPALPSQRIPRLPKSMAQVLNEPSTNPQFTARSYISGQAPAGAPVYKRQTALRTTPSVEGTPPKQGRRQSTPQDTSPLVSTQQLRQSLPPREPIRQAPRVTPLFSEEELPKPPTKRKRQRKRKPSQVEQHQPTPQVEKAKLPQGQSSAPAPKAQVVASPATQASHYPAGGLTMTISTEKRKGQQRQVTQLPLTTPKVTKDQAQPKGQQQVVHSDSLPSHRKGKRDTEPPVPLAAVIDQLRSEKNIGLPPCGGEGVAEPQIWPSAWPDASLERHRQTSHKIAELFLWIWRVYTNQREKRCIFVPTHVKRIYLFVKYHFTWFQQHAGYFFPNGYRADYLGDKYALAVRTWLNRWWNHNDRVFQVAPSGWLPWTPVGTHPIEPLSELEIQRVQVNTAIQFEPRKAYVHTEMWTVPHTAPRLSDPGSAEGTVCDLDRPSTSALSDPRLPTPAPSNEEITRAAAQSPPRQADADVTIELPSPGGNVQIPFDMGGTENPPELPPRRTEYSMGPDWAEGGTEEMSHTKDNGPGEVPFRIYRSHRDTPRMDQATVDTIRECLGESLESVARKCSPNTRRELLSGKATPLPRSSSRAGQGSTTASKPSSKGTSTASSKKSTKGRSQRGSKQATQQSSKTSIRSSAGQSSRTSSKRASRATSPRRGVKKTRLDDQRNQNNVADLLKGAAQKLGAHKGDLQRELGSMGSSLSSSSESYETPSSRSGSCSSVEVVDAHGQRRRSQSASPDSPQRRRPRTAVTYRAPPGTPPREEPAPDSTTPENSPPKKGIDKSSSR